MTRDFTLSAYRGILAAGRAAGYVTFAVVDWFDVASAPPLALVLRHDVDRRPRNALAMATAEAESGIRATYYFRILPVAFDPAIVKSIADLGHEIGYHYEDFHLANYQPRKAVNLFRRHLAMLRAIAPVRTIAMHGSPLSRFNNMEVWKHARLEDHGVRDCILSHDWNPFVFLTDTGRTFGSTRANLRDTVGGQTADGVRSSADVARCLAEQRHALVHLSTHPERWNESLGPWLRQLGFDTAANAAKRMLGRVRRDTPA